MPTEPKCTTGIMEKAHSSYSVKNGRELHSLFEESLVVAPLMSWLHAYDEDAWEVATIALVYPNDN